MRLLQDDFYRMTFTGNLTGFRLHSYTARARSTMADGKSERFDEIPSMRQNVSRLGRLEKMDPFF